MAGRTVTEKDLIPFKDLSQGEQKIARFAFSQFDRDDVTPEEVGYLRHPSMGLIWGTYDPDSGMMMATPLEHPFECLCCGDRTKPQKIQ